MVVSFFCLNFTHYFCGEDEPILTCACFLNGLVQPPTRNVVRWWTTRNIHITWVNAGKVATELKPFTRSWRSCHRMVPLDETCRDAGKAESEICYTSIVYMLQSYHSFDLFDC